MSSPCRRLPKQAAPPLGTPAADRPAACVTRHTYTGHSCALLWGQFVACVLRSCKWGGEVVVIKCGLQWGCAGVFGSALPQLDHKLRPQCSMLLLRGAASRRSVLNPRHQVASQQLYGNQSSQIPPPQTAHVASRDSIAVAAHTGPYTFKRREMWVATAFGS